MWLVVGRSVQRSHGVRETGHSVGTVGFAGEHWGLSTRGWGAGEGSMRVREEICVCSCKGSRGGEGCGGAAEGKCHVFLLIKIGSPSGGGGHAKGSDTMS